MDQFLCSHAGLEEAFKVEEAEVFKALELLCKDSAAMKGYNKACLSILQVTRPTAMVMA